MRVALAASREPRRGLQILTWKHAAVVVIAALVYTPAIDYTVQLIVIGVIGAAMALASPLGRWLLLLLAIPAYPLLPTSFPPGLTTALAFLANPAALIDASYLPSLALTVLAARRASSRSPKPLGAPDALAERSPSVVTEQTGRRSSDRAR
jgi:hypothetical protein